MSTLTAYGRLLWRPRTLLLAFVAWSLAAAAVMWAGWAHQLAGEGGEAIAERRLRLLLVAIPLVLGAAAMSPVRELMHAQVAWHLPGLRRRMGVALAGVGVLAAAGTVIGLGLGGWLAVPALPAVALALLAYALGLLVLDGFHPRRRMMWVVRAAVVLLVLASELVWSTVNAATGVAVFASTYAVWLFQQALSRESLRRKALQRVRWFAGLVAGPILDREDLPEPAVPLPETPPPLAPRGDRPWMWVRAAWYEVYGARRHGWVLPLVVVCLFPPFITLGFPLAEKLSSTRSLHAALPALHEQVTSSSVHFNATFLPILVLFLLGQIGGEVLKPHGLPPISRAERARILWRFHASLDVVVVTLFALGLSAGVALVAALSGAEGVGGPVPAWLRPLVVVLVLTPLWRCALFTRLGQRSWMQDPAAFMLQIIGMMIPLFLAVGLTALWERHLTLLPPLGWYALALALLVATQLALRARLASWFARCDLVR